jgi:hypothetical protein
MVPEIIPVNFEPTLIVHMHELMHHRVLHMCLAEEISCTEYNGTPLVLKAPRARPVAGSTQNILRWHITASDL